MIARVLIHRVAHIASNHCRPVDSLQCMLNQVGRVPMGTRWHDDALDEHISGRNADLSRDLRGVGPVTRPRHSGQGATDDELK